MKIWDEVSGGIDYADVDFKLGDMMARRGYSDTMLASANYFHGIWNYG